MRAFLILTLAIVAANSLPYGEEIPREPQGVIKLHPAREFNDSLREVSMQGATYACGKNSPSNPSYSGGTPKVMLSHIFCGQIVAQQTVAQGLHSQNAGTNYAICAKAEDCKYGLSGNGYCKKITIKGKENKWIKKNCGSSMWKPEITPDGLVAIVQKVSNGCRAERAKATCITNCKYAGNSNAFEIFLKLDNQGQVTTSYPTLPGWCVGDKVCDGSTLCGALTVA